MRTDTHRVDNAARSRHRLAAALWVLGSGLLAFLFGWSAISLTRDQLHIRCSMGPPGSEGADSWHCSDGIGYVGVAVVLGVMWFLVVLAGSLVALLVERNRTARVLLVLLAAISTAWILGWTWYGSSELVQDEYAPMTGTEYWAHAVGPAAAVSTLSVAAGLVTLVLTRRLSWIIGIGAALGLAVATILQPGLSLNTLPAVGLLASAAVRGVHDGRPHRPAASPRP